MFSLKVCRNLSGRLAVSRVPSAAASRLPVFCAATNAAVCRRYSDDKNDKLFDSDKYKVFKDDESSVILDVEEERALLDLQIANEQSDVEETDRFDGLNTLRGVSGVYEIEHLVDVLQKNNASDVFVASVPANLRYVDYIVVASGRSNKHLMGIAEFVHKLFKKKRNPTDTVPRVVHRKPSDWIAMDLGNIALHLLLKETRKNFDLETFWSVGEKYDSHLNRPVDSLTMLLNEHSFSLQNLEPVDCIENIKKL